MAREMLEKILEAEKQADEKLVQAKNDAEKIISDASVTADEKTKAVLAEARQLYDKAIKEAEISAEELIKTKVEEAKKVCVSFSEALDVKKNDCFNAVLSKIVQ